MERIIIFGTGKRLNHLIEDGAYQNIWNNNLVDLLADNRPGVLWVRGKKK